MIFNRFLIGTVKEHLIAAEHKRRRVYFKRLSFQGMPHMCILSQKSCPTTGSFSKDLGIPEIDKSRLVNIFIF